MTGPWDPQLQSAIAEARAFAESPEAMAIDGGWLRSFRGRSSVDVLNALSRPAPRAATPVAEVAGRTGVIRITGALMAEANMLSEILGWTTYEDVIAAAGEFEQREDIDTVVLAMNSPGGVVRRVEEAHTALARLNASKPITAFAVRAQSAGYWLASAATRIVAEPGGEIGSVGVVMSGAVPVAPGAFDGFQFFDVTSLNATNKRPNPLEPEGLAAMQAEMAPAEAAFYAAVAAGRGIAPDAVAEATGNGRNFTPVEAQERGLIDDIQTRAEFGAASGASLFGETDSRGRLSAPINPPKGASAMPDDTTVTPAAGAATPAAHAATPTPGDLAAITQRAIEAERARSAGVRTVGRQAGMDAAAVDAAIETGTTVDAFRQEALAHVAAQSEAATGAHFRSGALVMPGADARDKFVEGVTEGILARAGHADGKRNEFSGYSLAELARESIRLGGHSPESDRMAMIGQAFSLRAEGGGMHGPGDFPKILSNVANKFMLMGYETAEETFQSWTSQGTLSDFKTADHVGLNLMTALPVVADGASYTFGTMGERREQVTLATYGKKFAITRHTIINDDLNAFSRVPQVMGRTAIHTVGNLVYAILTGNPNMADGVALFHANHGNLDSAAAIGTATFKGARKLMRAQKVDGQALNLNPAFVLVPPELEHDALVLVRSGSVPGSTVGDFNPYQGFATVVADQRLADASATAHYFAASPNSADTVGVFYLNGQSAPYLEQKDGWDVDGVEFKVRIDAAAKALDYRGLVKNAGA